MRKLYIPPLKHYPSQTTARAAALQPLENTLQQSAYHTTCGPYSPAQPKRRPNDVTDREPMPVYKRRSTRNNIPARATTCIIVSKTHGKSPQHNALPSHAPVPARVVGCRDSELGRAIRAWHGKHGIRQQPGECRPVDSRWSAAATR